MFTGTVSLITHAALVALLIVSPAIGIAQQFEENDGYFIRKGYQYKQGKLTTDTVAVIDPISGEESLVPKTGTYLPLNINGKMVYGTTEVTTPARLHIGQAPIEEYLLAGIKDNIGATYFSNIKSLVYLRINLKNVIVDEEGKVVFFEIAGTKGITDDGRDRVLSQSDDLKAKINKMMSDLPPLKPAQLNGVNVMSYIDINLHKYKITRTADGIAYTNDGRKYRH